MKKNLLSISDLVGMPTEQLEKLLREETTKSQPDDDLVLVILHQLEDREQENLARLTPREAAAFEEFRRNKRRQTRKALSLHRWLVTAASAAMVTVVLFTVMPQQAEAETFWEMLQRWTTTVVEYFSKQDNIINPEYVFKTDHPGLQQVYDAVVELGITDLVVPMWLPEGSELTRLDVLQTPMSSGIGARFSYNGSAIGFKIDVYEGAPAHQFYRDDVYYEEYEKNGIKFRITQNNGSWVAVWTKENIECFLTLDCQEDTLRRILGSLFVTEET